MRPSVMILALVLMAAPAGAAETPRTLSLADAVRLASTSAPSVEIATSRLEVASARAGQTRAALLPSLTGSASALNRTQASSTFGFSFPSGPSGPVVPDLIGPTRVLDARVRLSQTVFDLATWQRLHAAQLGVQQGRADRGTSAEAAAQAAALAYVRAARAQVTVAARVADLGIAEELAGLAEAQRSAGTSPVIDVTRARTQVAVARGARIVARNQLERARLDLARALGVDPATSIQLTDTLAVTTAASDAPEDPAALLALALEQRNELRSQRATLARARAERSALGAERLPRLDAMADVGPSGTTFDDALTTRQYGVALTWPLFDGTRREERIAEQSSVVRESETRERDVRQQIEAEVRSAELDLASGLEQQDVARERLQLAEAELAQARERFTSGVAGNIEVIDAQSSLVRARDADIDARFTIASARIALARSAGVARTLR